VPTRLAPFAHLVGIGGRPFEHTPRAVARVANEILGEGARLLLVRAELELKASRALREDEGMPIERILTPGRPPDPDRPIDVHIDVEA
jgi:hypothetical protein